MSTASVPLPNWINYALLPLINLTLAFLVSGLVVWIIGENPWEALKLMLEGALGSGEGIGFTLFYATNFIFTGLSVAVAYHAGLFNIGSEGQAYLGGLGAALALGLRNSTVLIFMLVFGHIITKNKTQCLSLVI